MTDIPSSLKNMDLLEESSFKKLSPSVVAQITGVMDRQTILRYHALHCAASRVNNAYLVRTCSVHAALSLGGARLVVFW